MRRGTRHGNFKLIPLQIIAYEFFDPMPCIEIVVTRKSDDGKIIQREARLAKRIRGDLPPRYRNLHVEITTLATPSEPSLRDLYIFAIEAPSRDLLSRPT